MFFRNLSFLRFPTSLALDGLGESLLDCALKPVGPLELSSQGFVPPLGHDTEGMVHTVSGRSWVAVGGEDRILPAAVVNDVLTKQLAEIEKREGRKPGGRARKRLKEEVVHTLLPKAFVRPRRTDAFIDPGRGIVVVDTSSRKTTEAVGSEIRRALGSFPALPANAETSPRAIMTGWLAGEPLPEGLSLGEECELRDGQTGGAVWKGSRVDLGSEEIAQHLEAGKQVTRLALVLGDRLSFVFGEDLVVRKLKFLDGAVAELEGTDRDDALAELDARAALMMAEVGQLFDTLEATFSLSRVDA